MRNILKITLIWCGTLFIGCNSDDNNSVETPPVLNSENLIEKFVFEPDLNSRIEEVFEATINQDNKTITLTFPENTNVTDLKPILHISEKATVSPSSGEAIDFSNPITYTVTAEDETTRIYTIEITVETSELSFCEIPNGNFESWRVDTETLINGTEVSYDMPNDWTEFVGSAITRFSGGYGFFNKYDYPEDEGSALLIKRSNPGASQSKNNGFIRFNCSTVPNKLTGKYKFIGSSMAGVIDTLRIAVHFSKAIDTLTTADLHSNILPDRARYLTITEPTDSFNDFEIDVNEFLGQEIEYATIQLIMKQGNSGANPEYSTALIDSLKFE